MSDYRILVVDDDEDHRFIIGECLKAKGFTNLSFAISGEDGVEKVRANPPDIVLTDTDLGRMDGFAVCETVKKEFPHIKVVVMTGHAGHVNFPAAQRVGADEYKVKTGDCGEIIWGLRRCVADLDQNPPKQ